MAADDADSVLATETVAHGKDGDATGLTVVCHPEAQMLGATVRLLPGLALRLGRKSTDLGTGVLVDSSVSRDHATVQVSSRGEVEVVDSGSHNGTLVNGTTISRAMVRRGDVVRLGRILLLVDDNPPQGEHVDSLPGFAGLSGTWQRLTRVASVLASRTTPVLVWGPEGSGCRALAQAIAEPGPVHILREPPRAWPQQGSIIVTQINRWPADALKPIAEQGGARKIVVAHQSPGTLANLPAAFREAVVPWTLAVSPLASRRVDVAAIAWDLCVRFAGPDARPTAELIERLLRMPQALHARTLEAIVERAAIESADQHIGVFAGLDTHHDPARVPAGAGPTVSIARDGTWCVVGDGARVDFGGRKLLQRLVVALCDAALNRPGEALGVEALFAAGWPGDRTSGRARTNRVYVALTRLRQAGLQDVLARDDAGYRFDPSCTIRWADAST